LLDPADDLTGAVIDALDNALGLGGALAPAIGGVDNLTNLLNDALSPLVGADFSPDDPMAWTRWMVSSAAWLATWVNFWVRWLEASWAMGSAVRSSTP